MNKLTYEEWRKTINVQIDDKLREEIAMYHNIDADAEIKKALQREYKFYLEHTHE